MGGGVVCSLANYSVAYEETQSNRVSDVCDFVFFVSKGNPFLLLFYTTIAGVVPCGGRKSLTAHHHSAGYILSHLRSLSHPGYFENRILLKPALGGVCSLANYIVAYEETQSKRVSAFRDFVCSLFPKAIFLTSISIRSTCSNFPQVL